MSLNEERNNPVNLGALYQDIILDHQKDPRHFGKLEEPDMQAEGFNPMCGDRVSVQVKLDDDHKMVVGQAFSGEGCSICMASASMMTEELEGASVEHTLAQIKNFREVMQGLKPETSLDGDLEALVGVKKFPVRIKCALLPWTTLKSAIDECPVIKQYKEQSKKDQDK